MLWRQFDPAQVLGKLSVGAYIINVRLNGDPLPGSPLGFSVVQGPPDGRSCRLVPPNRAFVHDVGSRPTEVRLETFDTFGNSVTRGGALVSAKAMSPPGATDEEMRALDRFIQPRHGECIVEDQQDGTYIIKFTQVAQRPPHTHPERSALPSPRPCTVRSLGVIAALSESGSVSCCVCVRARTRMRCCALSCDR